MKEQHVIDNPLEEMAEIAGRDVNTWSEHDHAVVLTGLVNLLCSIDRRDVALQTPAALMLGGWAFEAGASLPAGHRGNWRRFIRRWAALNRAKRGFLGGLIRGLRERDE